MTSLVSFVRSILPGWKKKSVDSSNKPTVVNDSLPSSTNPQDPSIESIQDIKKTSNNSPLITTPIKLSPKPPDKSNSPSRLPISHQKWKKNLFIQTASKSSLSPVNTTDPVNPATSRAPNPPTEILPTINHPRKPHLPKMKVAKVKFAKSLRLKRKPKTKVSSNLS